jgi:hypothetical protein
VSPSMTNTLQTPFLFLLVVKSIQETSVGDVNKMKPSPRFTSQLILFCSLSIYISCVQLSTLQLEASVAQPSLDSQTAAPTSVEGVTAEIVKARGLTSQLVVLANKNYPAGSDKYNRAFILYAEAYSDYTAWAAYLTAALRVGHAKHLNNNPDYDRVATAAEASGSAFTNYVTANTPGAGESHVITTLISSLADLGIKLWTGISKQITTQRNNSATGFCEATKWQTWQEITDVQAPKQSSDYCKIPTDSGDTPSDKSSSDSSSNQNKSKNTKQTSNPKQ